MNNQSIPAHESQDESVQLQTEPSSSSSSEMLMLQQKMRTDFIKRQQRRLDNLIAAGSLNVGYGVIVWIDENGLLSSQHIYDRSSEELEEPVSLFHAGPGADVDEISRSFTLPHHSWGQEGLGKETPIWGSLLKKHVIKELRVLPIITHSIWKELLVDLERLAAAHTSPSVMAKKLEAAIAQEEDDWSYFVRFIENCYDAEEYNIMDQGDISRTVYRLAGVNGDPNQYGAALREIDESLANKIMDFSNLMNEWEQVSFHHEFFLESFLGRVHSLTKAANELSAIFTPGKRGPIMKRLLEVMEDIKTNPERPTCYY
ncbi:hypothetical protein GGI43DRAFT_432817 [Trichoderma evansii]